MIEKARSLLYRRQILQENIRWKALDEIYKIYMLLHRSDLNISENFRETFPHFSAKRQKLTKSGDFRIQSGAKVYKFCRSRKMQKNDEK